MCEGGGRGGQGQHGAGQGGHGGEDAPEVFHDALPWRAVGEGACPYWYCSAGGLELPWDIPGTAAWNSGPMGEAASPGGWLSSPGGVGAMAADTVADQTELADFGILGPLEVSRCGRAVPLGGPRQRAVLALLLLEANRVVSLDRLAEDVWAGHPPDGWVTTVQIYVSHLRQALEPGRARGAAGDVLVTRNPGYLLRANREQLDAARFQDGFTAGRAALEAGRYAEAAGTLRQALGLWRSGVLADLADYAFTRPEATRLEELRLAAVEARIDADLALGRHDALTAELEQLVAAHPLREQLHGQLMLALYRGGRQAGALAAYGGSVTCSPVSSASTLASRCSGCTPPCWHTTRHSTGTVTTRSRPKVTAALTTPPRLPPRRPSRLPGRPDQAVLRSGRGGAAAACWSSARRWRSRRPRASSPWPGRGRAGRPACRPAAWA